MSIYTYYKVKINYILQKNKVHLFIRTSIVFPPPLFYVYLKKKVQTL